MSIREARLWALLIMGVAYWGSVVRTAAEGGPVTLATAFDGILANGAFAVLAWGLLLQRAAAQPDPCPAGRGRIATTLLCGLVALVPARVAAAGALALLGALEGADRRAPAAGRQIAILLAALALGAVWTSALLGPLHVRVGMFDAQAAAALLRAGGHAAQAHANVVDNPATGFAIAIWPACASTFPLADVGLAFVAVVLHRGHRLRAAHLPWLALAGVASIALTECRLALLALDEPAYQWWHVGPGLTVYALAALGLAVLFPVLATSAPPVARGRPGLREAA